MSPPDEARSHSQHPRCTLHPLPATRPTLLSIPPFPAVSLATDNSRHVNHFPNEVPQGHPGANDTPVRMVTDEL